MSTSDLVGPGDYKPTENSHDFPLLICEFNEFYSVGAVRTRVHITAAHTEIITVVQESCMIVHVHNYKVQQNSHR